MSVAKIWPMSSSARELMLLSARLPVPWEDQDMAAATGKASALIRGSQASCSPRPSSAWKNRAYRLAPSVSIARIGVGTRMLTNITDYIGNEQETQRNPSVNDEGDIIEAVSSNIDDRTMHEV